MTGSTASDQGPRATSRLGRRLRRLFAYPLLLALLIGGYYAGGAFLAHRVDTDPTFAAGVIVPAGGARTVAVLAAVLAREVDRQGWVANDPAVLPGALLDGMAAFQLAIRDEVRGTVEVLAAGAADPDLETALGALAMPGDVWAFDLGTSWRPQRTSESFYREAVDGLRRFNARASAGTVPLPLAAARDTLLERIETSLDAGARAALAHVETRGGRWRDREASRLFHRLKGSTYTQLLVVQGLADDLEEVATAPAQADAVAALAAASRLYPRIVVNGRADGVLRPAHLAVQAALLLRARDAIAALRRQAAAAA